MGMLCYISPAKCPMAHSGHTTVHPLADRPIEPIGPIGFSQPAAAQPIEPIDFEPIEPIGPKVAQKLARDINTEMVTNIVPRRAVNMPIGAFCTDFRRARFCDDDFF